MAAIFGFPLCNMIMLKNICCTAYSPLPDRNTYIYLNSLTAFAFCSYLNSSTQIAIFAIIFRISLISKTNYMQGYLHSLRSKDTNFKSKSDHMDYPSKTRCCLVSKR